MTETEYKQEIKTKNDFIYDLMNELRESYTNYDDMISKIKYLEKNLHQLTN